MNALLLIIIIIGLITQNLTKKEFSKRMPGSGMTFSAGSVSVALIFFLAMLKGDFSITLGSALYAVAFATAYTTCMLTTFAAIKIGPLSLTALISSYSLIIPTIYGVVALHEPVTLWLILGLVFLLASLAFVNLEKRGEEKKITVKWLIYVAVSFVGNGLCTVIQRLQQLSAGGLYKNEFMVIALTIALIVLLISAVIFERRQMGAALKKGAVFFSLCGIGNGVVNLLVMVLALKMPASVTFPIISGGSIVITTFIAWLFYKEKLSKSQIFGVVLGVASIVLLNL